MCAFLNQLKNVDRTVENRSEGKGVCLQFYDCSLAVFECSKILLVNKSETPAVVLLHLNAGFSQSGLRLHVTSMRISYYLCRTWQGTLNCILQWMFEKRKKKTDLIDVYFCFKFNRCFCLNVGGKVQCVAIGPTDIKISIFSWLYICHLCFFIAKPLNLYFCWLQYLCIS